MSFVAADALCRLDTPLVDRIQRRVDLAGIAKSAAIGIGVGGVAYGFAFGFWRGVEQGIYSAIKIPLLLFLVCVFSTGLASMLATLVRAKLSLRQTAVCILLSLALTATVLGSVAPISIFFTLMAEPSHAHLLGLDESSAVLQPVLRTAHALELVHVATIALAGTLGVLRLRTLLVRLGLSGAVLRRVLVSFVAVEFFVGAQLSWLLRPFFGRPHIATTFLVPDAFTGNFYAEIGVLMKGAFGEQASVVFVVLLLVAAAAFVAVLMSDLRAAVDVVLEDVGIVVQDQDRRVIRWAEVALVRVVASSVSIELQPNEALEREEVRVTCRNTEHAQELASQIESARRRMFLGPFRTAPLARNETSS